MDSADEAIAARIREQMASVAALSEKRMFGGLAFLVGGKMTIGVSKGELMVRADPDDYDELAARPGARPMDFTGRPMRGWLAVSPDGFASDEALAGWIDASLSYVMTLPAE